jgi:dCTP deaminase
MILSGQEIADAIKKGIISISPPPNRDQFSTSSLDLRIGKELFKWKTPPPGVMHTFNLSHIDFARYKEFFEPIPLQHDGTLEIPPNVFVLGRTLETIGLPTRSRIAARIEGRSGPARLGLSIHLTAPTVHAGWHGVLALEIMNFGPFPLRVEPEKTCIAQIVFERLGGETGGPLVTDFLDQDDPFGKGTEKKSR